VFVMLDSPPGGPGSPGSSGWSGAPSQCPGCGGRLRRWGYARARWIRARSGPPLRVRPRRVRCAGCGVTHVLLPASAGVPRRADAVSVIGAALLATVRGHGYRRVAAELGRPASTVRGWIRSATGRAELIRVQAVQLAAAMDGLLDPPHPAGSPLGDALQALGAAVAATIRRLGPIAAPWPLAAVVSAGLLGPLPRTRSS
jgi:hypothetical protein